MDLVEQIAFSRLRASGTRILLSTGTLHSVDHLLGSLIKLMEGSNGDSSATGVCLQMHEESLLTSSILASTSLSRSSSTARNHLFSQDTDILNSIPLTNRLCLS